MVSVILKSNNCFYIFISNKIFFKQKFLKNKIMNKKIYTLFYLLKIMYRFGLVYPILKNLGY